VRLAVDILVTADAAVTPAMQATKTLPIVFASAAAPVEIGYVASYARCSFLISAERVAPFE
jgi:hypothetical protein